jgi:hypothetical protein
MNHGQIDLLPEAIRARSQAGVVAGRYVASLLIAVVLLGLMATHSRLMLELARDRLRVAEEQADMVLAAEAKAVQLRRSLDRTHGYIQRYERVALPLEVSRVIATIINELPDSTTLDRIDLRAGTRQNSRNARDSASVRREAPQERTLIGELTGFAVSDEDVASIVANLEAMELFDQVSIDFSRTRTVREKSAREFRVSFGADLDVRYAIEDREEPTGGRQEQTAHVE